MNSVYRINKERAKYTETQPSLTDQSQANETDINVIVSRYGVTGQVNGNAGTPMYDDFSNLPEDLRGFIDAARSIQALNDQLPEALRDIPTEELLNLTAEQLASKLAPTPANSPATTEEEPK